MELTLQGIEGDNRRLALRIGSLSLPKPLDGIELLNLRCDTVTIRGGAVTCRKGQGELRAPWLDSPLFGISFILAPGRAEIALAGVRMGGGRADLDLAYEFGIWRLRFRADGLSGQSGDGRFAGEGIALRGESSVWRTSSGRIAGRGRIDWTAGALYAEPVYLEAGADPVSLAATVSWDDAARLLNIVDLHYSHRNHVELKGWGAVSPAQAPHLRYLELEAESLSLEGFYAAYVAPFFAATSMEGVSLAGELSGRAVVENDALKEVEGRFSDLAVADRENRFGLKGGSGELLWRRDGRHGAARAAWESAKIYALPLGRGGIGFETRSGVTRLSERVDLPVLGGQLLVESLEINAAGGGEPDIRFQGAIRDLSLEQLTEAFGWTPLSGKISGEIPGIALRAGSLNLDGSLRIHSFDGEIRVESLGIADLFGDLPTLSAQIEISNLDLHALTEKFSFGNIAGRLDGRVRGLRLEKWRPVGFDAWFGTPEVDDSRRRISQKAVESLTRIGGGAATVLSRGVLRFFDDFGYERIGIGCRLQGGVCDLTSAAPVDNGYYIVKGGGVPRIDVIGYNRRIDWNVLLQRLERVTAADAAVVQ